MNILACCFGWNATPEPILPPTRPNTPDKLTFHQMMRDDSAHTITPIALSKLTIKK